MKWNAEATEEEDCDVPLMWGDVRVLKLLEELLLREPCNQVFPAVALGFNLALDVLQARENTSPSWSQKNPTAGRRQQQTDNDVES